MLELELYTSIALSSFAVRSVTRDSNLEFDFVDPGIYEPHQVIASNYIYVPYHKSAAQEEIIDTLNNISIDG